jgi:hypothetical protein
VYLIEQQHGRWALVREFTPSTLKDPTERVVAALRLAVAGTAADPDLTSAWAIQQLSGDLQAEVSSSTGITIQLSAGLLGTASDPTGTTTGSGGTSAASMAGIAVQQLVWTATAAANQDLPVRIEGPAGTSQLFGSARLDRPFTRATGAADPRAPVWVSSITDGVQLHRGTATITGDAVTTSTGSIGWTLTGPEGTVVATGKQLLLRQDGQLPKLGERALFSIHLSLPTAGRYQLSVTQDWQASDGSATTWTDTKTIQVT